MHPLKQYSRLSPAAADPCRQISVVLKPVRLLAACGHAGATALAVVGRGYPWALAPGDVAAYHSIANAIYVPQGARRHAALSRLVCRERLGNVIMFPTRLSLVRLTRARCCLLAGRVPLLERPGLRYFLMVAGTPAATSIRRTLLGPSAGPPEPDGAFNYWGVRRMRRVTNLFHRSRGGRPRALARGAPSRASRSIAYCHFLPLTAHCNEVNTGVVCNLSACAERDRGKYWPLALLQRRMQLLCAGILVISMDQLVPTRKSR